MANILHWFARSCQAHYISTTSGISDLSSWQSVMPITNLQWWTSAVMAETLMVGSLADVASKQPLSQEDQTFLTLLLNLALTFCNRLR